MTNKKELPDERFRIVMERFEPHSIEIKMVEIFDKRLSPNTKLLLFAIRGVRNNGFKYDLDKIKELLGFSDEQIDEFFKELESVGLLEIDERKVKMITPFFRFKKEEWVSFMDDNFERDEDEEE